MSDAITETSIEAKIDQINACVHCGYCLPACPTYLSTGNEGNSPRGRLYLIRDLIKGGVEDLGDTARGYLDNCLGCQACETSCPSGVEYIKLLEYAREERSQTHYNKGFWALVRRTAFQYFLPNRFLLNISRLGLRAMNAIYSTFPFLPKLVKIQPKLDFEYKQIETARFYPSLSNLDNIDNPDHCLIFNLGCVMDTIYNQVHVDTIKLLNALGFHVYVPDSACCGALASHSGEFELGHKQRQEFMEKQVYNIDGLKINTIVSNSAGCGAFIKDEANELKVVDIAELLDVDNWQAPVSLDEFKASLMAKDDEAKLDVTYHPACHLNHAQGIQGVYEKLLSLVPSLNLKALYEADVCCGSAGFYNLIKPDMADDIGKRKAENIQNTEAKFVLTANPGCMSQIEAHLPEDYKVEHPISFLAKFL